VYYERGYDDTPFIGRNRTARPETVISEKNGSPRCDQGASQHRKSDSSKRFAKNKKLLRFEGIAPTRQTQRKCQREELRGKLITNGNPRITVYQGLGRFISLSQNLPKMKSCHSIDEITWMERKILSFESSKVIGIRTFRRTRILFLFFVDLIIWIEKNIISSTGFFGSYLIEG